MKRLTLILIILLAISAAFAQSTKLGYVNADRVLLDSNEAAEIARLFQLDKQNWTNQVRALDDEIKRLERDFEIRKLSINEATKRDLQNQITTKKTEAGRMLEEYFGEGGKAELRYRELIDPLTKKIHDIIKKIAEDEKYTMILDVSMGVVLYAAPSIDITEQVLQELNKDTIKPTPMDPNMSNPNETKPNTTTPGFSDPPMLPFGDGFGDSGKPESTPKK